MTRPARLRASDVDMSTVVGEVRLRNPVMTAAGTAGHGDELIPYGAAGLGAVVVKSISAGPWQGNPAPRVHPVDAGMLNSVGLQNPGIEHWLRHDLPALRSAGATVVASIWGFTVEEYRTVAAALAGAQGVAAVEVNVSCPNVEDRRHMFGHSPDGTREVIAATAGCGLPRWAKLSPNVTDITEIAGAAIGAGASALTLVNTVMGLAIDIGTRRAALGNGGGGLSGPAIRPVAVRAVHDCRRAFPDVPIVGVGGVARGEHAIELMMVGAHGIQVGTATFYDPHAPVRVAREMSEWCARNGVRAVRDVIGAAL